LSSLSIHRARATALAIVAVAALLAATAGCDNHPAGGQQALGNSLGRLPTRLPSEMGSAIPSVTPERSSTSSPPRSTASPSFGDSRAWSEDFDGPRGTLPEPSLFSFQTGGNGWGNKEVETYTDRPQNASLDGHGDLVLTMRHENFTGSDGTPRHYTSARLTTLGHWSFETGTLSARIQLPTGAGLWPAFWLVGTNIDKVGWPACGEIDVVETVNSGDTEYTSVHGPDDAGKFWTISGHRQASSFPVGRGDYGASSADKSFGDGFHVYSVTRAPGSITARIDGIVIGHLTRSALKPGQRWVFDEPMAALLNVAVGGFWPGAPTPGTPASASMVVDWLRYEP